MKIYVLDTNGNMCPINVPGEIYVAGIGVSHGYLFDKNKTQTSFVNCKFNDELLYKTGDIGFYNENGELHFVGRNDFQVKINGLRIELAEIEKNLLSIPDVESCMVIADKSQTYLKAFFVAKSNLSIPVIRKKLAEKLPFFMVPKIIEQLDNMPVTPNGKIDRAVLETYASNLVNDIISYTPPETKHFRHKGRY